VLVLTQVAWNISGKENDNYYSATSTYFLLTVLNMEDPTDV